jgi:serine/threonine protein kinase
VILRRHGCGFSVNLSITPSFLSDQVPYTGFVADRVLGGSVMELLQPGDPAQVGQYRIVRRLGSGGMGRVYLAQSRGGRPVALKMINPGLTSDPGFARRFAREAEAASKVNPFYTAPVIDADPFGDPPWLATTYVPGPSLQDALVTYGGPLPVAFVRSLGAALAEGLGAIHAAGVVHCDLKPSNVLLATDGPRIIDFGISRAVQATTQTSSAIIGTPAFMSPEQVNGPRAGPPSDVFSLGSVLTYAATGHPPFSADTLAAMIQAVAFGQPFLGRLPRELRPLIERCLDKDPRQRPTTPQIVAELGPVPLLQNWLPEPLARQLSDYSPPVITPAPLYSDARGPITDPPRQRPEVTDPPRWRPEDAAKVPAGPPPNVPARPPGPPVRRPPRRRAKPALAISGAVTISIAITITLALHLAPHSPSHPPFTVTSSSTPHASSRSPSALQKTPTPVRRVHANIPRLVLHPSSAAVGQSVTARATGFGPNLLVQFFLQGQLVGQKVANSEGTARISFAIPSDFSLSSGPLTASASDTDANSAEAIFNET